MISLQRKEKVKQIILKNLKEGMDLVFEVLYTSS